MKTLKVDSFLFAVVVCAFVLLFVLSGSAAFFSDLSAARAAGAEKVWAFSTGALSTLFISRHGDGE